MKPAKKNLRNYKRVISEKLVKTGPGIKHIPTAETRRKVRELTSYGITQEGIGRIIGVSHDTLNRKYRNELDIGMDDAIQQVAGKLFKKAVEDEDISAIIFFLKTRGRWRTEDNKLLTDSNDEVKDQLKRLRERLDAENKKEY